MKKSEVKEAVEPVKKQNAMQHLKIYNKEDVLSLTKIRRFETKLGERLQVVNDSNDLAKSFATSNAKYVLFGVPEDLGAKIKMTGKQHIAAIKKIIALNIQKRL